VALIDQRGRADELGKLLLPLNKEGRAVFGGICFEPNKTSETFLLKEDRRKCEARGHTAKRLARLGRGRPRIQQASVSGLFVFSAFHVGIRCRSRAKV
jgi:hypothetical protein